MASLATLAFVGCKKKNKDSKTTGKNNTTVITTITTKSGSTTKAKTTTAKLESSKKCYLNADTGSIVKVDVEKGVVTNVIVCFGSQAVFVRPSVENGKLKDALVVTDMVPDKSSCINNCNVLKNADKFTPIAYITSEMFDYDTSFYLTARVSDDKIEFQANGNKYSVSLKGVMDNSFQEITTTSKIDGYDYTFSNDILTLGDPTDGGYTIKLSKDEYKFNPRGYINQILFKDGKAILSKGYMAANTYTKNVEYVYSFNDDKTVKTAEMISLSSGIKMTSNFTYSSDKKTLTVASTMSPYEGNYSYPLAVFEQKNQSIMTFDDYNRLLNGKSYSVNGSTQTLQTEATFAYDNNGNVTSDIVSGIGKHAYEYEYSTSGALTKVMNKKLVGSDYVTAAYYTIEYGNNRTSHLKAYVVDGENNILEADLLNEYNSKNQIVTNQKLLYNTDGTLKSESFKYTYEFDGTKSHICHYKPVANTATIYMDFENDSDYEEVTKPDDPNYVYNRGETITKYYDVDGNEINRTLNIQTIDTDAEHQYKTETKKYFKDLDQYLTTEISEYDNPSDENLLYYRTCEYDSEGTLIHDHYETYALFEGDYTTLSSFDMTLDEDIRTMHTMDYFEEVAGEKVPTGKLMYDELLDYDSVYHVIYKDIKKYFYIGSNQLLETREFMNIQVVDGVDRYVDIVTEYSNDINNRVLKETAEYKSTSFNVVDGYQNIYTYGENDSVYRDVYWLPVYTDEDYLLKERQVYGNGKFHTYEAREYTLNSNASHYYKSKATTYEFLKQDGVINYDYVTVEASTSYNELEQFLYHEKTNYVFDLDISEYPVRIITSQTQIYDADYIVIFESFLNSDEYVTVFRASIDDYNNYRSYRYAVLNEEAKIHYVLSVNFVDGTNNIDSAALYTNNFEDENYTIRYLPTESALEGQVFDDELLDELLDPTNYGEVWNTKDGYYTID
ncbi:MAG: hypothetical protein J6Y28_07345 [Acholeplasmatales bacterium]|nr:hypothetical protein [Acholeplasmatales bacterium]